jgi:hypothetical protein
MNKTQVAMFESGGGVVYEAFERGRLGGVVAVISALAALGLAYLTSLVRMVRGFRVLFRLRKIENTKSQ